ncbi:MAG: hypothetical protein KME22_12235 [Hassallia sp. WJT32-NPBG1]|nr:hypothetical protein [Hassallia sp. WJT32-NPBG1]
MIGSAKRCDQVAIDTDMNPADGDVAVGMTKMTALSRYGQRGGWHGLLSHQS